MSLRLKAAGLLVRGRRMTRWLELIDHIVTGSLVEITGGDGVAQEPSSLPRREPGEYRLDMAERHANLVKMLVEQKGKEAAIQEGRQAMREAGISLGQRLRSELRLSDHQDDLFAAARLMYRILGIEFEVIRVEGSARMLVRRCALSERYTPLTCEVISAMDEGVVAGLRPGTGMRFVRRNSGGPCPCEAVIVWEEEE